MILYIIKDFLTANPLKKPTKSEFYLKKADIEAMNPTFVQCIDDFTWERIRGVTKAMYRKHKDELIFKMIVFK